MAALPFVAATSHALRKTASDASFSNLLASFIPSNTPEPTSEPSSSSLFGTDLFLNSIPSSDLLPTSVSDQKLSVADTSSFDNLLKSFQQSLVDHDATMLMETKDPLPEKVSLTLGGDDDSSFLSEISDQDVSSIAQSLDRNDFDIKDMETSFDFADLEKTLGGSTDLRRASSSFENLLLDLEGSTMTMPATAARTTSEAQRTESQSAIAPIEHHQTKRKRRPNKREQEKQMKELNRRQSELKQHINTAESVVQDTLSIMFRLWKDGKMQGL